MSDINKKMNGIQENSSDIERNIKKLLLSYDNLFRETNRLYIQERSASQNPDELEDFYRLLMTLKRNRDVVASTLRAIGNLRSLKTFEIVEEEEKPIPKPIKRRKKPIQTAPEINVEEIEKIPVEGD